MGIKLIALDLDGTLAVEKHEILPSSIKGLIQAQENGIRLVIASGRPKSGLFNIAKQLQMDAFGGYFISFNGALVSNWNEDIVENKIEKENIHRMYKEANKRGLNAYTFIDNKIVCDRMNESITAESEFNDLEIRIVDNFLDFVKEDAIKCTICGSTEELDTYDRELVALLSDDIMVTRSGHIFIDGTKKNVNKGTALYELMDTLGLSKEEVMAFGDGENDIDMLTMAGVGVAMGNANDNVKKIADYVTDTNLKDGIYKALKEYQII